MKFGISKLWFFHSICFVDDKVVLHNTNPWENRDFKNVISYDLYAQLFLKFKGLL